MGPQFTRSTSGELRINDWNFNYWGNEEPGGEYSVPEEAFDRDIAAAIDVSTLEARSGPTGVRMIHEGGGVTHNGRGTMIAVESVVIQRNLGPNRFCGGQAPVTDYSQPNTYAPNPDWPACRALVEDEYRRMLGVQKVIWIPTGVVEDNGTYRGPQATHIHVPAVDGADVPHAGFYTMFTTNGHTDEVVRFVSPDTVVLAQENPPASPGSTPAEQMIGWIQQQNHARLERVNDILSRATNEAGEPLRIIRIPVPVATLDVLGPGDGTYDFYAAFDRWEDGSTFPERMLGVWAASYVNYVPTNNLVLVARYWKPGRAEEVRVRDNAAVAALRQAFPGRDVVQVDIENVNRGGGGMNCITQQQPASAPFVESCGWAKVKVDATQATLYTMPRGGAVVATVTRLDADGDDVYLRTRSRVADRIEVQVTGASERSGTIGWIDAATIESAGERCQERAES
jgi:agmatine deiminase